MLDLQIAETIIPEPVGGVDATIISENIKDYLLRKIPQLKQTPLPTLLERRYHKFRKIGDFQSAVAD
jgi:acetyl-CoA carboxylase carboxyl transferase subunit alpha